MATSISQPTQGKRTALQVVSQFETDHSSDIHDVQMDEFGERLLTCSSDGRVKVFKMKDSNITQLEQTIEDHKGPVWCVRWGPREFGSIFASCSYDKRVIIYLRKGNKFEKIHEQSLHKSSVNGISFAPVEYGLRVVSVSSDETIVISSTVEDASPKHVLKGNYTFTDVQVLNSHSNGVNCVCWKPFHPRLFLEGDSSDSSMKQEGKEMKFVTGGSDNLIKVWSFNVDDNKWVEEAKLQGHKDWIKDVAWGLSSSLDRTTIVSCSQDKSILVWTLNGVTNKWTSITLAVFDKPVYHVSMSGMGNIITANVGSDQIEMWKLAGGKWWTSDELQAEVGKNKLFSKRS